MTKSGKIDCFIREMEQLIGEQAPGFTSALPGQRELAERFGISQSAVHIGMAKLARRGLIRIEPYRGAVVVDVPRRKRLEMKEEQEIHLAVCEDMISQRKFWQEAVRQFRILHDGVRVELRFFSAATPVEETLSAHGNQIVIRPEEYRNIRLPLVPLDALLTENTLATVRRDFLSTIPDPDWSVALPYQLQVPAVISTAGEPPRHGDVMQWLEWAGALGIHSLPVPDLNFLRDSCGLNRIGAFFVQNGRISPQFRLFFVVLEKMASMRLINLACREPDDLLRQLQLGMIRCIWVFSHNWGNSSSAGGDGKITITPLPLADDSCINFFLANAIMVGREGVVEAERAFFRYLVSARFQQQMLEWGTGLSPYGDVLAAYHPEAGGIDLSRMIEWVSRVRFDDSFNRNFNRFWFELLRKLRSPVMIPLLLGRITAEEAEAWVIKENLLVPDGMDSVLADSLYCFGEELLLRH